MPMAAVPVPERTPMLSAMAMGMGTQRQQTTPTPAPVPESFARDAILAWFRGEFAAANAIIDALCNHLTQVDGLSNGGNGGGGGAFEYGSVFAAIHQRRLNWIPILQMQKYFSIADVVLELQKVAAKKKERSCSSVIVDEEESYVVVDEEKVVEEEVVVEIVKQSDEEVVVSEVVVKEEEEEEETVNGEVVAEIEEKKEVKNETDVEQSNAVVVVDLDGEIAEENEVAVELESSETDDSSSVDRKTIDEGLQGQLPVQNIHICSNHDDCEMRRDQIKMTKGFIAKEPLKGHMVNVVKGLKIYEDIFTDSELHKLSDYISELHQAGRNGRLSGETFILFNQQLKGNKRELVQLGVPIFGQIKEEKTGHIEPIPAVLQAVIDHMIQWHLIPESRRPNSCIINFFDEGEYSQPYLKPPHLDQPISTLLLCESTMAFGRVLVSDNNGNYKGSLMLSLKEGSLVVMRGNSADMARHVMCPSPNKRVSITFCKVRTDMHQNQHPQAILPPQTTAMTLWQQPGMPQPYRGVPNGALTGYEPMEVIHSPKWGVVQTVQSPLVMFTPIRPISMTPRKFHNNGTGVFLPWTVRTKKPAKHLPPRAQRARLLALPSSMEPTPNSAVVV